MEVIVEFLGISLIYWKIILSIALFLTGIIISQSLSKKIKTWYYKVGFGFLLGLGLVFIYTQIIDLIPKIKTERTYYQNGKLHTEIHYKDGLEDGVSKAYYENGNLKYEGNFKSGTGILYSYYQNGKLKSKTPYQDGKIDGIESIYYEDGRLKSQLPYKQGKWDGLLTTYYNNNHLKTEIPYTFDLMEGTMKGYDDKGEPVFTIQAQAGKLIHGQCKNHPLIQKELQEIQKMGSDEAFKICHSKF